MSQVIPVYVFDLDGVITDPSNSAVNEVVIEHMCHLLRQGMHVAINTGRSYAWVEENLIQRLRSCNDSGIFTHFIVICEKGGETIHVSSHSSIAAPSEYALPQTIYNSVRNLFEQNASLFPTMFWDDTKKTMATIEKRASARLPDFQAEQHKLTTMLQALLVDQTVRIDPTTIATDVELPQAGKHAGAKLIYDWAKELLDDNELTFVSIGDSASDYEMARYFASQHIESTFVYVGLSPEAIKQDKQVKLITTKEKYSAGTLEFFSTLSLRHPMRLSHS